MENLKGKCVLLCVTGGIAAYKIPNVASALRKAGAEVHVIMTQNATQFITPLTFETLTNNRCVVDTFARDFQYDVTHISLAQAADLILIAPATGNSLAKLAGGIYDTPALLGAKSHLRNDRPLVLAVSTNDGLGAAAQNIGRLLNVRNIYFVPFGQDDPVKKPRSLVADFSQIPRTIAAALSGVQMQPMLSYGAEGEAPTLH